MSIKTLSGRYFTAFIVTATLTALTSGYLFLQFGAFDIFMFNRAIAEGSLLALAGVLLIGPITRAFDIFDRWLLYRKEMGIMAFVFGLAHAALSAFGLPGRSWSGFLERNPNAFWTGLIALAIFAVLFIFSFELIIKLIPRSLWWSLQNWGVRLAGLLVVAHLYFLRQAAWIRWYNQGGTMEMMRPFLPPITVVASILAIGVLLIRLSEFAGKKMRPMAIQLSLVLTVLALGWSVWHSQQKTPNPLPLTWEVCQNLAGSIIQESYPETCVAPGGRSVTRPIDQ